MIRTLIVSAGLAVSVANTASAAPLTVSSFVGDAVFNDICRLGTTNNQECENAIGEFRGGNGVGNGTYEQSLNTPTQFGAVTAQFTWTNGSSEPFELEHDASTGTMSLTLADQTITMPNPTNSYVGLSGANAMFIRIRNQSDEDTLSLTSMDLNGTSIGNLSFGDLLDDGNTVGVGSSGAGYLRIDGFDFGQAWSLTGHVGLDWTGSIPAQSRLNANFKVATLPEEVPVPLPATAWLLAGGMGLLGGPRRMRRT